MRSNKDVVMHALANLRGDDYQRASRLFARLTPEQMQEPYGQSGSTPAKILADYKAYQDMIDAAIDWVKALPE